MPIIQIEKDTSDASQWPAGDGDDPDAFPSPNPDRLGPVHETAGYVAAQLARDEARARPRPSGAASGITVIEADNQPQASSAATESSLEPVDDGPPMPFEPLDPPDDEQARAREEAQARELETLRRRESYGRHLELGHVVREFGDAYLRQMERLGVSPTMAVRQKRVLRDLLGCRTSTMGEHEWHCASCQQTYVYFNSCGNRHCPTCRQGYRHEWPRKVELDLLPVPYYHVILTLPRRLTHLVMAHGDALYSKVMQAGGRAILAVGRKFLGAQLAALCVLHTWGCLTARPESARKPRCSPAIWHADGGLRAAPAPA